MEEKTFFFPATFFGGDMLVIEEGVSLHVKRRDFPSGWWGLLDLSTP